MWCDRIRFADSECSIEFVAFDICVNVDDDAMRFFEIANLSLPLSLFIFYRLPIVDSSRNSNNKNSIGGRQTAENQKKKKLSQMKKICRKPHTFGLN